MYFYPGLHVYIPLFLNLICYLNKHVTIDLNTNKKGQTKSYITLIRPYLYSLI